MIIERAAIMVFQGSIVLGYLSNGNPEETIDSSITIHSNNSITINHLSEEDKSQLRSMSSINLVEVNDLGRVISIKPILIAGIS